MTKKFYTPMVIVLALGSWINLADAQTEGNWMPDANLRAAVREEFGLADNEDLTQAKMQELNFLRARNKGISNLSGLEHATNLTTLDLWRNSITDMSVVAGLTNLTTLELGQNHISDISAVADLTNLTSLGLGFNSIADMSAVSGLSDLTELYLSNNSITDMSAVSGLTNLRQLHIWDNSITDISGVAGLTNLTKLSLRNNTITDMSAVSGLTNLRQLYLSNNSISDVSVVSGLSDLTELYLSNNSITDISPLVANTGLGSGDRVFVNINPLSSLSIYTHIPVLKERDVTVVFNAVGTGPVDIPDANLRAAIEAALGKAPGDKITTSDMATLTRLKAIDANISDLTGLEAAINLTELYLWSNSITDISALKGLTNLTNLSLGENNISDMSPVAELTNLRRLHIWDNSITDISAVAGLTNLTNLSLRNNTISDISAVAGLTDLTWLRLDGTSITDISAVAGLTDLRWLYLGGNSISDISALTGLTGMIRLELSGNNISDISPLIANTGLDKGNSVDVSKNPLSALSISTHIPMLQSRGITVTFDDVEPDVEPMALEFDLSMPVGISLIHVPLKVTAVDGVAKTITSIADLYDALGGAETVNFLITYDLQTQGWLIYFGASDTGTSADMALRDDIGIIAGMAAPVSIRLRGDALGTNASSNITLHPGKNLVGLPLRDSRIARLSDLFTIDGIRDNVNAISVSDNGVLNEVEPTGDAGDTEITGGQSFILTAREAATVAITGEGWANVSGSAAAPPIALTGIQVVDTTPVLALRGLIVDEDAGINTQAFRVTVKNLSNGKAVTGRTRDDGGVGYQLTVVDIETAHAAEIGDILEILAQSPIPLIGVEPLRYTVTAEDVNRSRIQLPALVAYEIPAETQLLPNYPNPFNPETWIPYRLANAGDVSVSIYDTNGVVVRHLVLGHQREGYYTTRSRAAYWDGRNEVGEQVATGLYFYQLRAHNVSFMRKMVILK